MRNRRAPPTLIGTRVAAWSVPASATQTSFHECERSRAQKIIIALVRGSREDFSLGSPSVVWRRAAASILAAALLFSGAAHAHSWYPKNCCNDADCRPVPCDELVETRNGIMWRGAVHFSDAQVKTSRDQFCHVCAKEQRGTLLPYLPLCAFIQPSS